MPQVVVATTRPNDRQHPGEQPQILSHESQDGDRSPASSSRYSRMLTPRRHAACPIDQPACFRSCSSILGNMAIGGP